jgi:putative two-component system response regulator
VTNELAGASVLIVDDTPENLRLLTTVLKRAGLVPRPVTSGKLAVEAAVVDPPDLILLDVRMPEMSGFDVCRWLKRDERLKDIPVIFISGLQDSEDKVEAFRIGGADYILKPFHDQEVLARVANHLRLRRLQIEVLAHNAQLEERVAEQVRKVAEAQIATIFALAKLVEARDHNTGCHVERVQVLSRLLAEQMVTMKLHVADLTPTFIDNLHATACLHDIGKVGIPDAILLKPGRLDEQELVVMRQHSVVGAETLGALKQRFPDNQFLRMGVDVARSHHENWDGSGYPDGLAGKAIPLSARIVALADFYDALTSDRCYRPELDHATVRAMIEEAAGVKFDPDVVAAFIAVEDQFRRIRLEVDSGSQPASPDIATSPAGA